MAIFKSLISALSTYSKIPMPNIEYKENEGRFTMCFFPLVGLIIFGLEALLIYLGNMFKLSDLSLAIGFVIVPTLVTGGIHIDGFMDVCDALSSYRDKEKRLEILDDPHVGAFSIIKLLIIIGIWILAVLEMKREYLLIGGLGFIFARILSAFSVLVFKASKTKGMIVYVKNHASGICKYILVGEIMLTTVICILTYNVMILIPLAISFIGLLIYQHRVNIEFGGISGDTSGYFLVMTESIWMLVIMILSKISMI